MSEELTPPTIITIDHLGISTSVFVDDEDITIQEMLAIVKGSLITIGFTETQWEKAILEMADDIDNKYAYTNN